MLDFRTKTEQNIYIETTKKGFTDERTFPGRYVIRYSQPVHCHFRDVGQCNLKNAGPQDSAFRIMGSRPLSTVEAG